MTMKDVSIFLGFYLSIIIIVFSSSVFAQQTIEVNITSLTIEKQRFWADPVITNMNVVGLPNNYPSTLGGRGTGHFFLGDICQLGQSFSTDFTANGLGNWVSNFSWSSTGYVSLYLTGTSPASVTRPTSAACWTA